MSATFLYMDQVTVLQDWLHRDFNLPNIHTIKYKEAVYILSSADGACLQCELKYHCKFENHTFETISKYIYKKNKRLLDKI